MASTDLLHPSVRRRLDGLRASIRGRLLCEAVAWMVLAAFGGVVVTLGLDYSLRLEKGFRIVFTAAAVAVVLFLLWRYGVRPLRVPMDVPAMALLVEKRFSRLGDRLITAVEFSDRPPQQWEGVSTAMIDLASSQANEYAQALDFKEVVERRRMMTVGLFAFGAALLVGIFTFARPATMGLWFHRNVLFQDLDWPQDTYLKVVGYITGEGNRVPGSEPRVVRGDDLEIFAEVRGAIPGEVLLHAEYPSGEKMEVRMEAVAGERALFSRKFQTVAEPFLFYVTGGDDQLDKRHKHEVSVVDPPSLKSVRFRVEHRAYIMAHKRAGEIEQGSGIIVATPGSTVHLVRCVANKSIKGARLMLDGEACDAKDLSIHDGNVLTGAVHLPPRNLSASKILKVVLTGQDDTVNRRGQQFVIQIQPDLAATVEIKKRAVGAALTPNAYFPVVLQAKDDYGVDHAAVAVVCKGKPRHDVAFENLPKELEFTAERDVDLDGWGLAPGDVIQVFAEVRDNMPEDFLGTPNEKYPGGVPGPNISISGTMEFRIVKPEELQDSLVQKQKELRVEFAEVLVPQESARAKGLSAQQDAQSGQFAEQARNLLTEAGKLEQVVKTECGRAAETLLAVLEEMKYNRLKSEMTPSIIECTDLLQSVSKDIEQTMHELADCSRLTDAAAAAAKLDGVLQKQVAIKDKLQDILDKMIKSTTRQEMEMEVQKLIKSSEDLMNKIKAESLSGAGGLFTPSSKPAPEPTPAPSPVPSPKPMSTSKPSTQPATRSAAG